jgi:hypothetical protein
LKVKIGILPFVFTLIALLVLSSCAEKVCPANAREYQHRQLREINSKRKRDHGLFPKSMDMAKRKKKKKEDNSNNSEEEILE